MLARLIWLFCLIPLLVACNSTSESERDLSGELQIQEVWAEQAEAGDLGGAIFVTFDNGTEVDELLYNIEVDGCREISLHINDDSGSGRGFVNLQDVAIPSGDTLALSEETEHFLCQGQESDWEPGMELPITFEFVNAGEVEHMMVIDETESHHGDGHSHDH